MDLIDSEQAAKDQAAYVGATKHGNLAACISIEKKYGLYGYTPELVSIGLAAAVKGEDPSAAVENYISKQSC